MRRRRNSQKLIRNRHSLPLLKKRNNNCPQFVIAARVHHSTVLLPTVRLWDAARLACLIDE
jgi:hypothetical protein